MTALTLTEQADGSVRLAVTGAPTPGAAVANQTFTTTTALWSGDGAATIVQPVPGHAGNGIAIEGPIGGPNGTALVGKRSVTTTAGQLYEYTCWVYNPDPDVTVALCVDGVAITPETHPVGWTLLRGTFSTPSTAVFAQVRTKAGWWSTVTSTARTSIDDFYVRPVAAGWQVDTTIVRADRNGTRPVRLAQSDRIDATGALTVDDHEAATAGLVTYRLTDPAGVSVSASITRATWRAPVILNPFMPSSRVELAQVLGMDHQREAGGAVTYDVTDAFPAASGTLRARTGSLDVYCRSYADAVALEQLAEAAPVLFYRQADYPGADRYMAVRGTRVAFLHHTPDGPRWRVTLEHTETRHPSGYRYAGQAWTYAALAESGLTYAGLPVAYDTYATLAAGVQL